MYIYIYIHIINIYICIYIYICIQHIGKQQWRRGGLSGSARSGVVLSRENILYDIVSYHSKVYYSMVWYSI